MSTRLPPITAPAASPADIPAAVSSATAAGKPTVSPISPDTSQKPNRQMRMAGLAK